MFTRISDFEKQWAYETETTMKLLAKLTDESLSQAVSADDRTLGRLAWHLVQSHGMVNEAGLKADTPAWDTPPPATAAEIAAEYKRTSAAALDEVKKNWTDADLEVETPMYGEQWKKGFTLMAMTLHESHHRGQMSVLMRQAGLVVPGIYGPAREEWPALGMAAPAV